MRRRLIEANHLACICTLPNKRFELCAAIALCIEAYQHNLDRTAVRPRRTSEVIKCWKFCHTRRTPRGPEIHNKHRIGTCCEAAFKVGKCDIRNGCRQKCRENKTDYHVCTSPTGSKSSISRAFTLIRDTSRVIGYASSNPSSSGRINGSRNSRSSACNHCSRSFGRITTGIRCFALCTCDINKLASVVTIENVRWNSPLSGCVQSSHTHPSVKSVADLIRT